MPTFNVKAPDGSTIPVNAPEGATELQAIEFAAKSWKPSSPSSEIVSKSGEPGFLSRVDSDLADRGSKIRAMVGRQTEGGVVEGVKNAPAMAFLTAGQVAGGINDIAGEGLVSAYRGIVPEGARKGIESGVNYLAQTAPGKTMGNILQGGKEAYGKFSTAYPDAAMAVEGAGNIVGAANVAGAGKSSLKAIRSLVPERIPTLNMVKQATTKAALDAGYSMPPSMIDNAGITPRLVEGLSGKAKTNQLAGLKNQAITDKLAKRSIGLADDADLSPEVLSAVRGEASASGYDPLAKLGTISTGKEYTSGLDDIAKTYKGASKSFPGATSPDIDKLIGPLRVASFEADSGLDMIKVLREQAGKAYASGDKAIGAASKKAARAIEDQIEKHLISLGEEGSDSLKRFRDARELIAKTYTVEKALVEGSGHVDAKVFARQLAKNKPLTGDQKTIARFAQAYGDVAGVPQSGAANPFTVLDYGASALGYGINPLAAALPLGRVAGRYSILSKPAQRAMVNKNEEIAKAVLSHNKNALAQQGAPYGR